MGWQGGGSGWGSHGGQSCEGGERRVLPLTQGATEDGSLTVSKAEVQILVLGEPSFGHPRSVSVSNIGRGHWLVHLPPLGREEEYAQISSCCFAYLASVSLVLCMCLCGCTQLSVCCLEGKGTNADEVSPQGQPWCSEFFLCFLITLPATR